MSAILKTAAGIYILSVLVFSSWSKASSDFDFFNEMNFESVSSTGVVFEENGFLFFQTADGDFFLIHSNSTAYFDDFTLPVELELSGASIESNMGFDSLNPVLQVSNVKFLDK